MGADYEAVRAALLRAYVIMRPAPADAKVAVLAFGLVGSQSIFESEAKGAAAVVGKRLRADDIVARANTKTRAGVTIAAIGAATASAAAKLDREQKRRLVWR
jgi:hypothetical protein